MAAVTLSGVTKSYGPAKVIHDVDLAIADREFLVMVGPSGCGKSTLLRMIAGLEPIDGGEIRIGGNLVNNVAPKDRDIAMVFQSYALYPHMTVRQNMSLSLKLRGVPRAKINERVIEAATALGLLPLLDRLPGQLSGGQRQRVAMGRAIVRDPKVFLFDEALSNLDSQLRVQMRAEIKALHQRLRTTSIYVTHDQSEAMTLADRIVVMRAGKVEQIGAPLELYDYPSNRFVAEFIGSPSINLLSGRIERSDGVATVVTENGTRLPLPADTPGRDGQDVYYGIRPEHLLLAAEGSEAIAAKVHSIEPLGAVTQVRVEIADRTAQFTTAGRHDLRPGQPVNLAPILNQIRLFDAWTEAACR